MQKTPGDSRIALDIIVRRAPEFVSWTHVDKIRLFCWHLQTNRDAAAVRATDIARCYEELNLDQPSSIGPFFDLLERREPKEMSKHDGGYRLEAHILEEFDIAYGDDTMRREDQLEELALRITDARQRKYIDEVRACFSAGAYRAAVIMAWNLARDVLREQLVAGQPSALAGRARAGGGAGRPKDDVGDLTDRQLLDACEHATIISHADRLRLARRFDNRDAAVKPSATAITPAIAEDMVRAALDDVILRFQ